MITVFFDLETGGLDPARHPIVQIAAVVASDAGEELETFERKLIVDPARCEPEALEMNSYDADQWADRAIPPDQACRDFGEFLRRHAAVEKMSRRGKPYRVARLGGHNVVTFDRPFIDGLFGVFKEFLPADFFMLDTLQLAVWWAASLPPDRRPENLKLATPCRHFGIDLTDGHDALADVRATVRLAWALNPWKGEDDVSGEKP